MHSVCSSLVFTFRIQTVSIHRLVFLDNAERFDKSYYQASVIADIVPQPGVNWLLHHGRRSPGANLAGTCWTKARIVTLVVRWTSSSISQTRGTALAGLCWPIPRADCAVPRIVLANVYPDVSKWYPYRSHSQKYT